jgi:hypothetical protein
LHPALPFESADELHIKTHAVDFTLLRYNHPAVSVSVRNAAYDARRPHWGSVLSHWYWESVYAKSRKRSAGTNASGEELPPSLLHCVAYGDLLLRIQDSRNPVTIDFLRYDFFGEQRSDRRLESIMRQVRLDSNHPPNVNPGTMIQILAKDPVLLLKHLDRRPCIVSCRRGTEEAL